MKNVFFGISAEALAEVFGISTETAALLKSESKRQGNNCRAGCRPPETSADSSNTGCEERLIGTLEFINLSSRGFYGKFS
ncbi:hypothetical protein [Pectobacterium versatile]|uniref:hypothetical protein n=1 Tax=Pectobacterium versatile TaxID=2488639 RepID=UPI000DE76EDB|nr:hypothetical protein [Pectobacterium versatile]PVY75277.1 hypothetical protein C7330_4625 [Pectobacterium versatile]